MIMRLDLQDEQTVQKLWDMQQRAYRVEAELIGTEDIPPLRESVEQLRTCEETFYGFIEEGKLAGAVSFVIEGETLDIHRMIVDPVHFRKGIASQLLASVHEHGCSKIVVATGSLNEPAVRLYERHGFTLKDQKEVRPGLRLSFFEKTIQR
ncbi:GNAT family N-acetyltransferase [Brevibacillus sp. Leaf182]|uniref:GNAT family N-acetyltransferase n=1 Tax=Brevibacillus sp. Leaf182 TaxID=1736290 RepID=UPI000700D60A|nr:GNAT family N-acetyltransferase [Brevibacillus sp. Leaf182]RAT95319.1 GNAT family N-acetyltransferase [Brevibacillus sp. Leaf182]